MKTKICKSCSKRKPLKKFRKGTGKEGRTACCKICLNKKSKKRYWENPQKERDESSKRYHANPMTSKRSSLKRLYKITLEDYNCLALQQNGQCAICGGAGTKLNQYSHIHLVVDHNHKTGKVRGLLCSKCNHLLGNSNDDISILFSAIRYLCGAYAKEEPKHEYHSPFCIPCQIKLDSAKKYEAIDLCTQCEETLRGSSLG